MARIYLNSPKKLLVCNLLHRIYGPSGRGRSPSQSSPRRARRVGPGGPCTRDAAALARTDLPRGRRPGTELWAQPRHARTRGRGCPRRAAAWHGRRAQRLLSVKIKGGGNVIKKIKENVKKNKIR